MRAKPCLTFSFPDRLGSRPQGRGIFLHYGILASPGHTHLIRSPRFPHVSTHQGQYFLQTGPNLASAPAGYPVPSHHPLDEVPGSIQSTKKNNKRNLSHQTTQTAGHGHAPLRYKHTFIPHLFSNNMDPDPEMSLAMDDNAYTFTPPL